MEAIEKVEIHGNVCKLPRIAKQRKKEKYQNSGVNCMKDKKVVGKVTGRMQEHLEESHGKVDRCEE